MHISKKQEGEETKKAFLSDQCKEVEENNRIGKTRDLFKKWCWENWTDTGKRIKLEHFLTQR